MVKVHGWTDPGESAETITRDFEVSGSTYGPSLARHLYHREVQGYAIAAVDANPSPPNPVAMTIQWHRAADPMTGFFD
jgi:hypothetical protein